MESVGFKEWSLVCDAMGRGEQSLIVRKGGIAEGRAGFTFKHAEFFLFPTWFHEQAEKTRGADRDMSKRREGEIAIDVFARLDFAGLVAAWETAMELEPFHIWQREVVRERFEYDAAPGIHVALIRAYRLSEPWIIPYRPAYGGCRSWVNLPDVPARIAIAPVLDEAEHASRARAIRALVEPAAAR